MDFKETEFKVMPKYPIKVLGSLVQIKGRVGWKGYKTSDLRDSGPIVLGGSNIKNSPYLDLSDIKFLSREKYEESPEIKLMKDDVLLVTRGNIGDASYFDGTIKEATINPSIVILSNFNGYPKYLYYYLVSSLGRKNILSISSGSSVPAIYQKQLAKIKIPYPPIKEQKTIATILSTLDDKIEINNQINKKLQLLSQLLFKHWFVDFEFPNEEGFPYKSSGGEMVESELGMIPKGWEVGQLKDILSLNYGKALTSKDRVAGDIKVFSSAGHTGFHNRALVESDGIIVGRKGTIGTVYYVRDRFYCIDTAYYITQKDCKFDFIWTFELLKQLNLKKLNEDSAVPGLNRNTAYSQKIVVPTNEVVAKLSNILSSITKNIFSYSDENEILSNLKDTLLPKLMNGEIDLGNLKIN
jgi:type I restriction enzyme S subunit